MILSELMPQFGKFYCSKTFEINESVLHASEIYPIAIDTKRNKIRITVDDVFLFSDFKELENMEE